MRSEYLVSLAGVCLLSITACTPTEGDEATGAARQLVIGGAETPEDLGATIDRFQRNAAVGFLYNSTGQGCSATIVGDRVVVSAAHCVVANTSAWLSGAKPSAVPASAITFAVGDDVKQPDCLLQAESVHIHPSAGPSSAGAIEHDVSVMILAASVIDTCDVTVPVQINRETLTDGFAGREILQGGFGSLDASYEFSPIRYWSMEMITSIAPDYLTYATDGHGGPSYGDSGSGALLQFPDGSWRNLGVDSLGLGTMGTFVRLDAQGAFFDDLLTPDLVCGAVTAQGVCRDGAAVACGAQGFRSDDCAARGLECKVGDDGKAACASSTDECTCDKTSACDEGCACDSLCPASPSASPSPCEGSGCSIGSTSGGGAGGAAAGAALLLGLSAIGRRRSGRRRATTASLLGVTLALSACSGGDSDCEGTSTTTTSTSTSTSTSSSSSSSSSSGSEVHLGTCAGVDDLYDPTSCGAEQACDLVDFVSGKIGCRLAGSTQVYAECSPATPACVAGTICLGFRENHFQCAAFCDAADQAAHGCPEGGVCVADAVPTSEGPVGICLMPDDCDLLSSTSCGAGAACYLDDSGGAFCMSPGSKKAGAACQGGYECAAGLGCWDGQCAVWCDATKPCVDPQTCQGAGQVPGHPTLGVCE